MSWIIWIIVLVVAYGLFISAMVRYESKIAKELLPIYLNYDSSFSIAQSHREQLLKLVNETIEGQYSLETRHEINRWKSHERYSSFNDETIVQKMIEQFNQWEQTSRKSLVMHFSRMRAIYLRPALAEKSSVLSQLKILIEKSERQAFTIHNYGDWGKFEQPDESSSLRWELQMLFEEGQIPREKNYSGSN
jgi:hypothetical protein